MTWMQTASGVPFDLLNPRVEDVKQADVIHHLARLARFSGGVKRGMNGTPYVVLQHCALVMDILSRWGCPPVIIREGGWHECDEPYTGDLTRPLQLAVRAAYRDSLSSVLASDMTMSPSAVKRLQQIGELDPLADIRARVGKVARAAFGLPPDETPIVKRADNVALAIERRDLMVECDKDWHLAEYAPIDIRINEVWDTNTVERKFTEKMTLVEAQCKEETA